MHNFTPPQTRQALLRETMLIVGVCLAGTLLLAIVVYLSAT